jgi:hypothetical protein
MKEILHPCPFDNAVSCNMKMCEYCFGGMLPIENFRCSCGSFTKITGTFQNPCTHTGYYHIVTFLCFKRKFLACENCGKLIPQTKWEISI